MKRIYLLMALLVSCGWLAEPCQAQKLYEHVQNIFAPLDKTEIQSGILMEQTPIFIKPSRYDGRNTSDSMRLSLDRFGMLYGQFRNATIKGRELLPSPTTFLSKSPGLYQKSDTINLALLAMQYDYIGAGALEDELIAWSDGQLIDVAGRRASPYKQDTSFAFVALNQKVEGLTFHFVLLEELLFNNINWNVQQIEIDYGDGRGFQNVKPNETMSISYEEGGTKTIRLQYAQNGQTINMVTFINVKELPPLGGARDNMPYAELNPEIIPLGGMDLSIFSSCDDGKVRKPLIILEGFAGENFDISKMFELLGLGVTTNTLFRMDRMRGYFRKAFYQQHSRLNS